MNERTSTTVAPLAQVAQTASDRTLLVAQQHSILPGYTTSLERPSVSPRPTTSGEGLPSAPDMRSLAGTDAASSHTARQPGDVINEYSSPLGQCLRH